MQSILQKNNIFPLLLLGIFIVLGGFMRIVGIGDQVSYWNDESHVALYARAIVETGQPIDATGYSTGLYQMALYYITAFSFSLFGVNEFAGRLPSVLAGIALIPIMYFVIKHIIGTREALVGSFLMAFAQMQLVWSTQLRPYIWLELFTVLTIYWTYLSLHKKTIFDKYLNWSIALGIFSFLFHATGILNFLFIGSVFLYKVWFQKKYQYFYFIIPLILVFAIAVYFTPFLTASFLLRFNTYFYHYIVFLGYHYWWLGSIAAIGAFSLWKANKKELTVMLTFGAIAIILIAIIKIHARYVRYSITAFPLIYILFSVGITYIADMISKRLKSNSTLSMLIVFIVVMSYPIYREKILIQPRTYYALNGDMRENPIVNYKLAFQKINNLTNGDKTIIVGDAWYDRVLWYLPGQKYVLLINAPDHLPEASTIEEFEQMKDENPKGIMIVENWQSLTPPELQDYMRKTLMHEFDVVTVPGNEDDPWSISVYSWGL